MSWNQRLAAAGVCCIVLLGMPAGARADEQADAITAVRELAPQAAAIEPAVWAKAASSQTGPKLADFEQQTLTVLVLTLRRDAPPTKQQEAEFGAPDGRQLRPAQLARAIQPSRTAELISLLQPKYLQKVSGELSGDTLQGTIEFLAPGAYRGKVEYTAQKREGQWQLREFRWPAHNTRTRLNDDGKWQIEELASANSPPAGGAK